MKRIAIIICLVAITFTSFSQTKVVTVSNMAELLNAIAPNTTVHLNAGSYNLSKAPVVENEYCSVSGGTLFISGIQNFCLQGLGAARVKIFTEDNTVPVIQFDSSTAISVRNLELGHTPKGAVSCAAAAYVLYFNESSDISVDNCFLWGSGTVGIVATSVTDLKVSDTDINDCSDQILLLYDAVNVKFSDCIMHNNGRPEQVDNIWFTSTYLIYISNCIDIVFEKCAIYKNQSVQNYESGALSILFMVDQSINVKLNLCDIYDNSTEYFSDSPSSLQITNTTFTDNVFLTSNFLSEN